MTTSSDILMFPAFRTFTFTWALLNTVPLLAAAALLGYIVLNEFTRLGNRVGRLAGPIGYPLLGSLPSLRGTVTSDEYRIWAEKYGDVFQVPLGNIPAVIVNTAAAARALFITQREATNSRPVTYVLHKKVQGGGPVTSIGTSPWDESCKRRRKVAASALNKTSLESYLPILDLESRAFLRDILSSCTSGEDYTDVLDPSRKYALNLSLTVSYGTRYSRDLHKDLLISEITYIEEEIARLRDPTKNFSNYIPLLRLVGTVRSWLGIRAASHMGHVGKRRYNYHHVLQEKLRRDIAEGIDRPCIQGNVLKDPDSKGLTEGELLSVSMSMMAGAHTTKRSIMWALLLLAHRPDVQEKAYQAIKDTDASLLSSADVAQSKVDYLDALTKELGRYYTVQRLALPKATYSNVKWNDAIVPPNTLLFLNSWACNRDPALFVDPYDFVPERWLDDGQAANRHQYSFGIGGRMCVANHVAHKALYTVFLHLIAHFRILPGTDTEDPLVADPIAGLLEKENPAAEPKITVARFMPRNPEATKMMLESATTL
ncbi:uncharacterized protein HMPREF1541_10245 [Cyphellophora europaea CBS 101466]|uniref:3-hydroxyphenylacetate 6-hydroxylase n=1 Tax=Cyphellophora europaea (strain CBS 101466) TaxID=1220924 RepID=W2S7G8_CYPE1|nr:uncharacterized protein HMPREF1541_10245 [Cyphellophora europaea CBS 101466]ETN44575.1 hypothetical protein HMPREF1541_10245 [Cyphellophora europaea CBS 101466]